MRPFPCFSKKMSKKNCRKKFLSKKFAENCQKKVVRKLSEKKLSTGHLARVKSRKSSRTIVNACAITIFHHSALQTEMDERGQRQEEQSRCFNPILSHPKQYAFEERQLAYKFIDDADERTPRRIVQGPWRVIALNLGGNKITDNGFATLFLFWRRAVSYLA